MRGVTQPLDIAAQQAAQAAELHPPALRQATAEAAMAEQIPPPEAPAVTRQAEFEQANYNRHMTAAMDESLTSEERQWHYQEAQQYSPKEAAPPIPTGGEPAGAPPFEAGTPMPMPRGTTPARFERVQGTAGSAMGMTGLDEMIGILPSGYSPEENVLAALATEGKDPSNQALQTTELLISTLKDALAQAPDMASANLIRTKVRSKGYREFIARWKEIRPWLLRGFGMKLEHQAMSQFARELEQLTQPVG
ncbi:MAG: hypothetical protein WBC45_05010, partial [Atribacterota bacterium]